MKRFATVLCSTLVIVLCAASPWAQTPAFERVEGQVRENIPAAPFLAGAYGFIWVAVLVYVVSIARRLHRVQGEIADLRHKIEGGK